MTVVLMDLSAVEIYCFYYYYYITLCTIILPGYCLRHGHCTNTGFYIRIYSSYINQITISCTLSLVNTVKYIGDFTIHSSVGLVLSGFPRMQSRKTHPGLKYILFTFQQGYFLFFLWVVRMIFLMSIEILLRKVNEFVMNLSRNLPNTLFVLYLFICDQSWSSLNLLCL